MKLEDRDKAEMMPHVPGGGTGVRTCRTLGATLTSLDFCPKNKGRPLNVLSNGVA